jgi:hypothetical protein
MAKFQKIKPIIEATNAAQTALTGGDSVTAQTDIANILTMLKDLKKEMVGADDTVYTYRCNKCGLPQPCKIVCGLVLGDLTFCLDEMKTGIANFKEVDVSIGA